MHLAVAAVVVAERLIEVHNLLDADFFSEVGRGFGHCGEEPARAARRIESLVSKLVEAVGLLALIVLQLPIDTVVQDVPG